MRRALALASTALLLSCPAASGSAPDGAVGARTGTLRGGLVVDGCDDPEYRDVGWSSWAVGDLVLRTLPGTAAETELPEIAAARQQAYDDIVAFLGLTIRPRITVTLSPNRRAARAHGVEVGRAFPATRRIEVLWLPGEGAYERVRFGHELAHVLSAAVDGRPRHLPLLNEGLAELLDGSGRDLHAAYVAAGRAEGLGDAALAAFGPEDVWGRHYGRAGSFVRLLVDRYGRSAFLDLWRAAAVAGDDPGRTTLGDPVSDDADLEAALDHLLRETVGDDLETVRRAWAEALAPYLAAPAPRLAAADLAGIRAVLRAADRAVAADDPGAYRAALEGFYCDGVPEASRAHRAEAEVAAAPRVETQVLAAYPVGVRNYPEVIVEAVRHERRLDQETSRAVRYWLERFPVGWRITWASDWQP